MASSDSKGCEANGSTFAACQSSRDYYHQLGDEINETIGVNIGWTGLIGSRPYPMEESTYKGFRSRYSLIKTFQEQTLALFRASLNHECDPEIARMVVGELPEKWGIRYHQQLTDLQHRTPVFFRTDEVSPGKLSEIQCSGSGWGLAEQLRQLYCDNESVFGSPKYFKDSLATSFTKSLKNHLGTEPHIHHLVDNASRPHGIRYFIQRTRREGAKYFSYDRGVSPSDCNFIRSHDFVTLPHHNFFDDRMEQCNQGRVFFDLPPSSLFDGKIILAWPFWEKTRGWYSDEVRSLFPYANIIHPDGIELEGGEHISIDEFCRIPQRKREFYVKYAGTDIGINWGSKSVFLASTFSQVKCRELMETIIEGRQRNRYWIVQQAIRQKEQVCGLGLDGGLFEAEAYSKLSGFYGPAGLMAILAMQKCNHKVHGSPDTIMSIVH
jgi:hypothetical protein